MRIVGPSLTCALLGRQKPKQLCPNAGIHEGTKQASATRAWGAAEATAEWEVVGMLLEKEDNSPRSTGMFAQPGSVWR